MFRRNEVKAPQEQGQNPHGDSSGGNGDRGRRFTFSISRRQAREQPAETLAGSSKPAEKQPEDSSKSSERQRDEMTGAFLSEESRFLPRRQTRRTGASYVEPSAIGGLYAAGRSEDSLISDLDSRIPFPETTPRDGLPPFRPRIVAFTDHRDSSDLQPIEYKSSKQSDESSSQHETPLDTSQLYKPGLNLASKTFSAWGNKTTTEGLATLTNQDLNNREAHLEKNVERSTDLLARHRAKKQIEGIHGQKRENKAEYFKGGLRKTYKNLIESMITVVSEDVKTTKEPKVHSKILKSDEAAKVVAEKRDKDKEKCTTHNRYAKINSNSLFRSGIEQSLSRQPEFYQIEKIILKQSKNKTQEVRSKLQEIRKRFDTDKTHLRAHGIVDIETGTVRLNGSDEVIHLHDIKSITTNIPDNANTSRVRISVQDDSSKEDPFASLTPSPIQAESSFSRRPNLRVSTTGDTLSPSDALGRQRRDSDAISFHSELSTHGSSDTSWTIKLSDKSVNVKNENTLSLLKTQHLINFQTGRIELGNGTIIDLKDIDWEKNKKDKPTELHLKQTSPLYKDGSTIDLKEASKSLDAAASANRQKYEQALRQYSLTQMALLEKVAYAGSSSLSDMHALLAGIRTNESALIKVQEDIFQLKRAEDSVTAFDFKEEVRKIGNEATKGLLHIRQRALNKASQAYAWALKSSAYADMRKESGRFGKFGETDTVKTIKGLHEGVNKGIELQNDKDLPKYDRLKAEEPEFVAQKTKLEIQRDDLAVQLERLNQRAKPLDTRDANLRDEDLQLYQKDVPLNKRQIELNKEAAPLKKRPTELKDEDTRLRQRQTELNAQASGPANQEGSSTTAEPQNAPAKVDEIQGQRDSLKSQIDAIQRRRDDLAHQSTEIQGQRDNITRQINEVTGPLARIQGHLTEIQGQRRDIATRRGEIQKQREAIWNDPAWRERESVQDQHRAIVAQCEKQDRKAAEFKVLEDKLATSKSPYTRNSYFIRKIAEVDALGQLDHVEKYVHALQRVDIDPGDNALVRARKEYENARVDHIVAASGKAKSEDNPNELRMALYEERYHASIVRYNTNRAKYALENKVSETVKNSDGKEEVVESHISRLKAVRKMHLEDIITDPSKLTDEQEAAQQKSQRSYDQTMYRVKPPEFVPAKTGVKSAADNAADFTVYARERARYEVQKLIDKTEDVNDKAKMIDNRGDLEKDFVDRFTKTYGEERARAHEFERVKMARKTMNDFARKQLWLSLLMNTQMAYNSFDQSVDSTMNSIIRSSTRTA